MLEQLAFVATHLTLWQAIGSAAAVATVAVILIDWRRR